MHSYWYCEGYIAFTQNKLDSALLKFEQAGRMNPDFLITFRLAQTYYKMNRYEEAANHFEKLISDYRLWDPLWAWASVDSHYYRAMALEADGKIKDAIAGYEEFLDIRKDADPELKSVTDARQRLLELKSLP